MKSFAILFLVAGAGSAYADPEPPKHRISIEQDPLPYLMHGWDGIVAYQHPALPHARVSLAAYAVDWPSLLRSNGFHRRQTAVTTKLAYHRGAAGRGWMAGTQFTLANEEYTHDVQPGHDSVDLLFVGAIAGYRWFPFDHGFFVYPWGRLGVSLPIRGDGEIVVGTKRMQAGGFSPVLTFHLGYELAL